MKMKNGRHQSRETLLAAATVCERHVSGDAHSKGALVEPGQPTLDAQGSNAGLINQNCGCHVEDEAHSVFATARERQVTPDAHSRCALAEPGLVLADAQPHGARLTSCGRHWFVETQRASATAEPGPMADDARRTVAGLTFLKQEAT